MDGHRTDTLKWIYMYILSNAIHCIGQTLMTLNDSNRRRWQPIFHYSLLSADTLCWVVHRLPEDTPAHIALRHRVNVTQGLRPTPTWNLEEVTNMSAWILAIARQLPERSGRQHVISRYDCRRFSAAVRESVFAHHTDPPRWIEFGGRGHMASAWSASNGVWGGAPNGVQASRGIKHQMEADKCLIFSTL